MNVLITGGSGQVGQELQRAVWPFAAHIAAPSRDEVDLARPDTIHRALDEHDWDLIINAAAYTAVDRAESEPDIALAINCAGAAALAKGAAQFGIPIIHISTDYVFDGRKPTPYVEEDSTNPINVYGRSKAAGEEAVRKANAQHIILRTSWVYSAHGANFIQTMLRNLARDELRIIDDQRGCPTSAADITEVIIRITAMIANGESIDWGTYHFAGAGETTWFGFAQCIFEAARKRGMNVPRLVPITTEEYPTPAQRPRNSRLDCSRLATTFGISSPPSQGSVEAVVAELLEGKEMKRPGQDSNLRPAV